MFTVGAALMMSISSTNTNPAITKASWDNHDKGFRPNPSSRIMVGRIALIIAQMVGVAPLPCPLPWCGGVVGKYLSIEMPNAVAILCATDCNT